MVGKCCSLVGRRRAHRSIHSEPDSGMKTGVLDDCGCREPFFLRGERVLRGRDGIHIWLSWSDVASGPDGRTSAAGMPRRGVSASVSGREWTGDSVVVAGGCRVAGSPRCGLVAGLCLQSAGGQSVDHIGEVCGGMSQSADRADQRFTGEQWFCDCRETQRSGCNFIDRSLFRSVSAGD